jgi:ABC-type proline/glycine betaine transport system substrate-binding protein
MALKHNAAALAFGAALALASPALADCELGRAVRLADGSWDSIQVLNSVAAKILKEGYGCDTELVTADMVAFFASLTTNDLDVYVDAWLPNNKEIWAETESKGAVDLGVVYPDGTEGWYVPRYVIEGDVKRGIEAMAPDLKSVADLPAHALLFEDPEEPGKGRFLNCPIAWSCQEVNTAKFDGYGLARTFVNFNPGSGAALDSAFASAYKRGEPVLGYYWEPSWLLGLYDMVKLEEPACTADNTPACASPLIDVHNIASAEFVAKADQVEDFFRNFKTTSAEVSGMLAILREQEGATREDAAMNFLRTKVASWTNWVTPEAAEKIKASL